MVGTPQRRHSSRHRRTAAILAQRAISAISPVRERDRRRETRRLARNRRARANGALLRSLRVFLDQPVTPPRLRLQRRQSQQPEAPIVVVSETSEDDLPPVRQPVIVDLDSSVESLPTRPQWQLPVQPLQDLGPLDVTAEIAPPLRNQTFREAYVLLLRMQLPLLQQITPPPELPPRPVTPPPEQDETWVELKAAVADFDGQRYILVMQPLAQQQPQVAPMPEHVPVGYQPPQQIDFAAIARALCYIAEKEHEARSNVTN